MAQAIQPACPICKKEPVVKYRPFCSKRCADIDLGGWLAEKYAVLTNETADQAQNIDPESGIE